MKHHISGRSVEVVKSDLRYPKDVEGILKDIDVVFHFAANPKVRVSSTNPEVHFNENVVATFNLLEVMRKNDVKELVFASEDWMTVDEVADEVAKAMGLSNVVKVYRPVLHGVGWPGDVKKVALKIEKLKALGFRPSMSSREAVRVTAGKLIEELNRS